MLKRIIGISLAALLLSMAGGAQAQKAQDTLRIAWQQAVPNIDQYYNNNREGIIFARMVWDTLIDRDPQTFAYKPLLATAWKWINDVTIEFELRQGVVFHNGDEFDADDVVHTLNFVADPGRGGQFPPRSATTGAESTA